MQKIYSIHAEWDDKANVWVATSEDVPGLATESETFELLMKKLEVMVPELLELNGVELTHEVSFELLAHRIAVAQVQTH